MDCTFYKVGNGLFAKIDIDGIVSVYDCGSTNGDVVKMAVNKEFGRNQNIDNLFISHYDKDHVNGIKNLLTSNSIKRVFLPMIPNLTRVANLASFPVNSPFSRFILSPEEYIADVSRDENTVVIHVEEEDGEDLLEKDFNDVPPSEIGSTYDQNHNNRGFDIGRLHRRSIPNRAFLKLKNAMYIPFNRRLMSKIELQGFLQKLGLNLHSTSQDILNELKKKNTNLKDALKQVFTQKEIDDINDYSMTLLCMEHNDTDCKCGLLTGDYNALRYIYELKIVYHAYWNKIEIVQIPHHGSSHSFHDRICVPNATHVVSAKDAPYKSKMHVDPTDVIKEIRDKGYTVCDTRKTTCNIHI